jgi:glycosyltransferase involved in cell wall biosynthesis
MDSEFMQRDREKAIKSLLVTPTYFPQLTGNAVTVHRISQGLAQVGVDCRIIDLSRTDGADLLRPCREFSPDIIHGFHAHKAGRSSLFLKKELGAPLVTTLTGTDVNIDLKNPERRRAIKEVLAASDLITVFNDHALSVLIGCGISRNKVKVIHQSVLLPGQGKIDFRAQYGVRANETVFLMSGGIRRVKRIDYAIDGLAEAKKNRSGIRLFIAGLVLEQNEYQKIQKRMQRYPWVSYLGQVSREYMPSLLKSVDVVLNTSASESEANALLEAFYYRKPVVARRIPGNASLLTSETGLLFDNRKEFYEKILYAIDNPARLEDMCKKAEKLIQTTFRWSLETDGYAAVYRGLMAS